MPPSRVDVDAVHNLAAAHCPGIATERWQSWIGEDVPTKLTHYTFDVKSARRGFSIYKSYVSEAVRPGRLLLFVGYDEDGDPQGDVLAHIESLGDLTRSGLDFIASIIAWSDENYDSWGKDSPEARQKLKFHLCRGCARSCTLRTQEEKDRSMSIHVDYCKVIRPSGSLRLSWAKYAVTDLVTEVFRERGQIEVTLPGSTEEFTPDGDKRARHRCMPRVIGGQPSPWRAQ